MFTKVLIANRGAIAVRIIKTLNKLGIKSVAVYSESDLHSLHVEMASEAYSLGAGNANDTYLNSKKIIDIALQCQAQAIHPGYGFLSENTEFATLAEDHHIAFIGPRPQQILQFGLKHEARQLALAAQVPLIPGSPLLNNADEAVEWSKNIGFPIMVKSTAGGGGIGMQRCYNEKELVHAVENVKHLGQQNFSNSGFFLEKYIANARHIEVQILGNGQGDIISLGTRDCTLQRRHQKVIEEAPAPGLTPEQETSITSTARQLMKAVNYLNASTVEFIYDNDEKAFYFLEVNTRLQVEHGVTEAIYNVDIVEWMLRIASESSCDLSSLQALTPSGHALQARVYAEDPLNDFRPSAGLINDIQWPESLRIDTWVTPGCEVSPFFDPLIAKLIAHQPSRQQAIQTLINGIENSQLWMIETNLNYLTHCLSLPFFQKVEMTTQSLSTLSFHHSKIEVLQPGTQTTYQDFPGRQGYWSVGIPPSGPFDSLSFQWGNQLLNNAANAVGLEITLNGPTLKFYQDADIVVTGAECDILINEDLIPLWKTHRIRAGEVLKIGAIKKMGARAYLCIKGGFDCPSYLGSRSTFTLGQFGGYAGRALRTGDMLTFSQSHDNNHAPKEFVSVDLPSSERPQFSHQWTLRVTYGPHGANDFFTENDIETFFRTQWEVHYQSNRTGVRLIGPKPEWARETGGEAGLHPSNIHDNAYAFGTVDFTGDMPIILGPDGPSLGGFVCPATVITADLWKLGQLKSGDTIQFEKVSIDTAHQILHQQNDDVKTFDPIKTRPTPVNTAQNNEISCDSSTGPAQSTPLLRSFQSHGLTVTYRLAGDRFILVEYGEMTLDLNLRFRVQALTNHIQTLKDHQHISGIQDLTPGIRSLQIHFNEKAISLPNLLDKLEEIEQQLGETDALTFTSRIVHLPLSWDDPACQEAIDKYTQTVRPNAPWCPSNLEFIRRINGLNSIEDVKNIVFDARYLVLGLGDVYLGAPVATPIHPAHRLVTTKYNPARTWTAENSVGIGGAYLCIYGMEGPGGYQFVGRTLQMWNRYRTTQEFKEPWLLRHFDQIQFYPVTSEELVDIRKQFPLGRYPIKIETSEISIKSIQEELANQHSLIDQFKTQRQSAFDQELQHWKTSGLLNFEPPATNIHDMSDIGSLEDNQSFIESPVSGSVWKLLVEENQILNPEQALMILESMKMEFPVLAPYPVKVIKILIQPGEHIQAGQALAIIEPSKS